jgi:nitrite reductase/ring-hydroxylating ferredoxin subunit
MSDNRLQINWKNGYNEKIMKMKIGPVSNFVNQDKTTINVKGKPYAIYNFDGKFYATDDLCTHEECSLGNDGFIEGTSVVCGCHGASFDIKSGKVLSPPASTDLKTYPISEDNKELFINL